MQVLKRGHTELFRRGPDECFDSLAGLTKFCQEQSPILPVSTATITTFSRVFSNR
jgi:hypothetical protein